MEFDKPDEDPRRDRVLRYLPTVFGAVVGIATFLVLPFALDLALARLVPQSWLFFVLPPVHLGAFLLALLSYRGSAWAARRVLGLQRDLDQGAVTAAKRPALSDLVTTAAPTLFVLVMVLGIAFFPQISVYFGAWGLALFMLGPVVVPMVWRRARSGRSWLPVGAAMLWTAIPVAAFGSLGLLYAWLAPSSMGVMAEMLPVFGGVFGFIVGLPLAGVMESRSVMRPFWDGDFAEALARFDDSLLAHAVVRVGIALEAGDLEEARAGLDDYAADDGICAHANGVLLTDEGDPEAGWKRLRDGWNRFGMPADVMTPALGLHLGEDVLDMVEGMVARRGRLSSRLLGGDSDAPFAACRAWALALRGQREEARAALPGIEPLPLLLATERDYLRARALHALGDPSWNEPATRAADGVGRAARFAQAWLASASPGSARDGETARLP